eukprot:603071-Rhodomonas_salina.3
MSGTDIVHYRTSYEDPPHRATGLLYDARYWHITHGAICLSVCYDVSGKTAYTAACLLNCYEKSSTAIAHNAICLRECYEMSGTETACTAITSPNVR